MTSARLRQALLIGVAALAFMTERAGLAEDAAGPAKRECIYFVNQTSSEAPISARERGRISDSGRLIATKYGNQSEIYDVETETRTLLTAQVSESLAFSPDDRFVASDLAVYDLAQGGKKLLDVKPGKARVLGRAFHADSSKIRYALSDGRVLEVELPSGKVREKKVAPNGWFKKDPDRYDEVRFSNDGSEVIYESGWVKYPRYIADLETGKRYEMKRGNTDVFFIGDGSEVVQRLDTGGFELLNLKTGKRKKFDVPSLNDDYALISSDKSGRRVLVRGERAAAVWDRDTGRMIERRDDFRGATIVLSPDGQSWLEAQGDQLRTFDLQTQAVVNLGYAASPTVSVKGRYAFYKTQGEQGRLYDTVTRQVIPIESPDARPTWVGETGVVLSAEGATRIIHPRPVCVDGSRKLAAPGCCGVPAQEPGTQQAVAIISEELVAQLCSAPYKREEWAPWAKLTEGSEPIPREQARATLMEMHKPGAFVAERHLPVLMAALRSDLPRTEPDLLLGGIETLAVREPGIYRELLTRYPYLAQLKGTGKAACRTPKEEAALLLELTRHLYLRAHAAREGSTLADWADLGPLKPLLARLKPEQKKDLITSIASSLLARAGQADEYRAAPGAELREVIEASLAPMFGEKRKPVSHLFLAKAEGGDFNVPLAVGSEPIDGKAQTLTPYGFYSKRFKPVATTTPEELGEGVEVSWTQAGRTFVGEFGISMKGPRELAPADPAPKYKELWKDRKLSGLFLFGNDSGGQTDEYLHYLYQQGFVFDEGTRLDFPLNYLEESVASGRIDYLVSGHGSGFGKIGVVRTPAHLLKGTRTLPDGREEVVELILPTPERLYAYPADISDDMLHDWIAAREMGGGGQLVRFGVKPLEGGNVGSRLRTVKSPTFVDIPFEGSLLIGVPDTGPVATVLTKFREGKSYAEIRAAVKAALPEVFRDESGFRFPDEPEYERYRQGLQLVRVSKPKVEAVTDAP